MFESIVSSVLNQVLGNYVDNLDGSQLKLGIFSGNVVLKNLKLKKEAIDKLSLPIEIFEGNHYFIITSNLFIIIVISILSLFKFILI